MALAPPTTQELIDRGLAFLESNINQTSPLNDKAFLRVLATMVAMHTSGLYRFAIERGLQNLALTATGDDLDKIGNEFEVIRKAAEAAILDISLPAANGTPIAATISFIGDNNGVRYFPDASAIAAAGVALLTVTAEDVGVAGNLSVSDTLSIGAQVSGAETTATVTAVSNIGAERETDDAYRARVLFAIRSSRGGGNATDHKTWAEGVAGVFRAYPYSGKPISLGLTSYPGDRVVYVQADSSVQADGIAPPALLTEVEADLLLDPDTAEGRAPLGLTSDNLWVESITRTSFFVTVTGLSVDPTVEAQVKADIETELSNYFTGITPFVEGVDLPQERTDLITDLSISNVVQDVLSANNASSTGVLFGFFVGDDQTQYRLNPGELGKLDTVSYV